MVVTPQQFDGDCGIAALATLIGIHWADVYVEAVKVVIDKERRWRDHGLRHSQVIAIARRLSWPTPARCGRAGAPIILRPVGWPRYDPDTDCGVLRVEWVGEKARQHNGHGHFVALSDGMIHCSTQVSRAPWREWLKANSAKASTLLRASRRS
jgi:hypothetical protein